MGIKHFKYSNEINIFINEIKHIYIYIKIHAKQYIKLQDYDTQVTLDIINNL